MLAEGFLSKLSEFCNLCNLSLYTLLGSPINPKHIIENGLKHVCKQVALIKTRQKYVRHLIIYS